MNLLQETIEEPLLNLQFLRNTPMFECLKEPKHKILRTYFLKVETTFFNL